MSLRCFIAILFALGLALPVQAAVTLGVVPEKGNPLRSESGVRQQTTQLEQLLNEEVRFRVFRSEAALYEWMQRYRMVDLALISQSFYNSQPAGSLILLRQPSPTDLAVARPGLNPETLHRLRTAVAALTYGAPRPQPVTPKSTPGSKIPTSLPVSPGDEELQPGHEILAAPGQAPRVTAQPAPTVKTKTRLKKSPGQTKSTSAKPAVNRPAPAVAAQKPAAVAKEPAPITAAAAPSAEQSAPSPALVLPPPQPAPSEPPAITPPPAGQESPSSPPGISLESPTPGAATESDPPFAVPWLGIVILITGFGYLYYRRRQQKRPIGWSAVKQKTPGKVATPPKPAPAPPRPRADLEQGSGRPMSVNRVPLPPIRQPLQDPVAPPPAPEAVPIEVSSPIPLVVEPTSSNDSIAALLTDAAAEHPRQHQPADRPSLPIEDQPELDLGIPPLELDLPLADSTVESSAPVHPMPLVPDSDRTFTAPVAKSKKPTRSPADVPPLRGDIATVSIPRLLELAAAQPGPCILHIRGRHDEKRLHFRHGHLADASAVNRANRTKTGFLMNKVGYLLIRQGRITEEQRDQALRLCEQRPKLRIGEALVELGALSRDSLLEALRTQVEGVIFSLFIFPDGRYEIVADDSEPLAASDLNISLEGLLSKTEAQEPEWARIRQAIPTLDTVLDFPEGGRDKLDSARMTEHQKLVLSLVDGHRPIRDICIAATMLDLEVYKFLFFMVNAKILIRA